MNLSRLDGWAAGKMGVPYPLHREVLAAYQLQRINAILRHARAHAPFYSHLPERVASLAEFATLPCVTSQQLASSGGRMLTVSQGEISRIVTLTTTGTSGAPKRLYYTAEDQQSTVDFFAAGLSECVRPGDTMVILLPCARPGGVGDLIATALERMGVTPVRHGALADLDAALAAIQSSGACSLVGMPVQAQAIARYANYRGVQLPVRTLLVSADTLPPVVRHNLRDLWGCEVFDHFGMTECGLGGGVECGAHRGCHLRENDIYLEVVHPDTLRPLPEGQTGELVLTMLHRTGMPLVRYRTRDEGRILPGRCACGSDLRRLCDVRRRQPPHLRGKHTFDLPLLDEALFSLPQVLDFAVAYDAPTQRLRLTVCALPGCSLSALRVALESHPSLATLPGVPEVELQLHATGQWLPLHAAKRHIQPLHPAANAGNTGDIPPHTPAGKELP